jgi:lipopolysaccharide transport system ATP-binding protein
MPHKPHILLKDVCVEGVDTQARAASLKQWLLLKKTIRPIPIPILNHVNFEAKPGDRIGILGSNGSGKSSMLKVITGNYPIKSGVRKVKGSIAPLIEMGAGFDLELSGHRNIKLSFAFRGKLADYSPVLEEKIIEFSELGEKIDLPLKTYSSGMTARLAFSSAIFQEPDILICDEILAAGDAGFIDKSRQAIIRMIDKVAITIIVNHSIEEIIPLCNRFILMDHGTIIMEGSPSEVAARYYHDILKQPTPSL